MDTTRITQHEADLARLLTLAERRVTGRLAAALDAAGATIEEWRVTSLLADDAGHPMTEIAEYALLPPPTLTKIVDRMVANNLVYRRVDDADRRRVLVFLSDRGRELHSRLTAAAVSERESLAAAAGAEELALLGVLLARIAGRAG